MKVAAKESGTERTATKESILQSELNKLQEGRDRFKLANQKYINAHPELRTIMDDFMASVVENKPSDILKFAVSYFGALRTSGTAGFPVLCVTGPPGVGKSTIVKMLMERNPDAFQFPVETTTRTPKKEEKDGVHFNFVSSEQFQTMITNGEFLTYRQVYQNWYGTTLAAFDKVRRRNKICLMDTDVATTDLVRASSLECKYLFIAPKSVDALEKRLKKTNKDTDVVIARKIEQAMEDMTKGTEEGLFDEVVTNDNLETCYRDTAFTLLSWYTRCQALNMPASLEAAEKKGSGGGDKAGAKGDKELK
jgi:guanylate kinase